MEGLVFDTLPDAGPAPSLAELFAGLSAQHLIGLALMILLAVVAADLVNPQRGVRR